MNYVYQADNQVVLESMKNETVDLIYIDPPFNTGKWQRLTQLRVKQAPEGSRTGFQGQRYDSYKLGTREYRDSFGSEFLSFLEPRLKEAYRILKRHGTLYFHIDYREAHYCKILLDTIFGKECFLNEIIWAYDYGGRSRSRWPAKHENILVYVKDPNSYHFNNAHLGSYLEHKRDDPWCVSTSDIWWHTIVPTNGKERTGYPSQKPRGIIAPIIATSSQPDDLVLDFFAGSGTTGECCLKLNRRFILVDNNEQAIEVMRHRFAGESTITWNLSGPHMFESLTSNLWNRFVHGGTSLGA